MYVHRPDILSLAFGLLFTALGLGVLLNLFLPDVGAIIGLVAITAGVGVAGSLLVGDVHRRAGARLADRARAAMTPAPPAPTDPTITEEPLPLLEDPLFGPPIDPEELDRAYRETFGDDGPDVTASAAGGTASGVDGAASRTDGTASGDHGAADGRQTPGG